MFEILRVDCTLLFHYYVPSLLCTFTIMYLHTLYFRLQYWNQTIKLVAGCWEMKVSAGVWGEGLRLSAGHIIIQSSFCANR